MVPARGYAEGRGIMKHPHEGGVVRYPCEGIVLMRLLEVGSRDPGPVTIRGTFYTVCVLRGTF